MPEYKILNSKEIKELMGLIEDHWGAKLKLDYGFLQNNKNKVFIVNREISHVDLSKLRVNSAGMYFCEIDKIGIRLSIEGTQIIGPYAKKNVIELDGIEVKQWFKGEDLAKELKECKGFLIIKHKNDFIGSGKYSNGKILNFIGKTRRISVG